jgi:hypothetical protein
MIERRRTMACGRNACMLQLGRRFGCLLAFLLLPAPAGAQPVSVSLCTESGAQHERQAMKARKAPAARNAATIPDVSVREMVRWAAPKNPSTSSSPLNARERQLVTVTGWVPAHENLGRRLRHPHPAQPTRPSTSHR